MKHILIATFITLLALGTGCAWISPASETASEGIQVHGHWTVTVSNPDGSVDAVHEFENELSSLGRMFLSKLLLGRILVDANFSNETSGQTFGWWIMTEGLGLPSFSCKEPHITDNNQTILVAQAEQDGIQSETKGIVLKAACNVEGISTESYSITKVRTLPFYKYSGNLIGGLKKVPMDDEKIFIVGSDSMFTEFTSHQFASPISIENLQLLAITVRITFD